VGVLDAVIEGVLVVVGERDGVCDGVPVPLRVGLPDLVCVCEGVTEGVWEGVCVLVPEPV
jgi:hypothetical protein